MQLFLLSIVCLLALADAWMPMRASSRGRAIRMMSDMPAPGSTGESTPLSLMEIRVGKIVEIGTHPEADTLFVEKVDIGEADGPRTIVSGLVAFCKAEELLNKQVVVLCNLKPRPLKGIMSAGMLLCASNADKSKVEPLLVPEGVPNGELITFVGHKAEPAEAGNRASKAYSKIADEFFVDETGKATYKGTPFMTSKGSIVSTLLKGTIS